MDYSVNATQLSAPQGAGAGLISPVTAGILDNGVAEGIGNIFKTYQKGLEKEDKEKAKQLEAEIVGGYTKKQARINDGIASGGLSASDGAARSRALFNEYAASYSQYLPKIEEQAKAFRGFSEMGEAEDTIKAERAAARALEAKAADAGYPIQDAKDPNTKKLMINAWQAGQKADAETRRMITVNAENRAQTSEQRTIQAAEEKTKSVALIAEVAQQNLPVVFAYAQDLSKQMREGLKPDEAMLKYGQHIATIESQILALSSKNPELAAPYRSLFTEASALGKQILNPDNDAKDTERKIQAIINKQRLMALSLPGVANMVATSELFKNSPDLIMATAGQATQTINTLNSLITTPLGGHVPQVTGTDTDKPALDVLKRNIDLYNVGSTAPKLKEELIPSIRNYMTQLGDMQGKKGITPKTLENAADFFANPSFGKFLSENVVSKAEMEPVKQVFQMHYESKVAEAVDKSLDKTFKAFVGRKQGTGKYTEDKTLAADAIAVNFDGATVSFGIKQKGTTDSEQRAQLAATNELSANAKWINQMVRIAAHMEGSTDYKAVWEARKHILLPRFFSAYEGLEIGQTVDGKRYVGGNPRDASSWK